MIGAVLLSILFLFIEGILLILRSFGSVQEESAITNGLTVMGEYLAPLNSILPIDTLLLILAFDLIFEGLYLTYKVIKWSYKKVPLVN